MLRMSQEIISEHKASIYATNPEVQLYQLEKVNQTE
jgi:hypothetical protein